MKGSCGVVDHGKQAGKSLSHTIPSLAKSRCLFKSLFLDREGKGCDGTVSVIDSHRGANLDGRHGKVGVDRGATFDANRIEDEAVFGGGKGESPGGVLAGWPAPRIEAERDPGR